MEKKISGGIREKESILEWLLKQRSFSPTAIIAMVVVGMALSLASYHFYSSVFGELNSRIHSSIHLTFIMVIAFFLFPLRKRTRPQKLSWYFVIDLLCIFTTLAVEIYILRDIEGFYSRFGMLSKGDVIAGILCIVLLLELTRRTVGWVMVVIACFFLLQARFTEYFPVIFYGPPHSWHYIIDHLFMQNDGIFGVPLIIMASYIMLFMFLSSFLLRTNVGSFFIRLAYALTGHMTGGPAKTAVVASGLMGTMSGTSVGNAVATGSFTIPLMKSQGYKPQFAGAVEACASSGGQIMPPVMGAAAFIMAGLLGVSYLEIVKAALIPGGLFFFSVFMMVHFEAKKLGMKKASKIDLHSVKELMLKEGYLLLPIALIVFLLAIGRSVIMAAFWTILSVFILSFIKKETRLNPITFLSALEEGVKSAIPVAIACAAAGIIIGSVFVSGVAMKFSSIIISASGGHLWMALVLTMFLSILLGMGMPSVGTYITLAALVVPAIIDLGVHPIAAHLFAYHFGIKSGITPPVAIVAFAAAGLAGSPPMLTGWTAFRIGITAYIVPYMFVYGKQLIMIGSPVAVVIATITAVIGVISLSGGMQGWLLKKANLGERCLMILAAILLIKPGLLTDLAGIGVFLLSIASQKTHFSLVVDRIFSTALLPLTLPYRRISRSFGMIFEYFEMRFEKGVKQTADLIEAPALSTESRSLEKSHKNIQWFILLVIFAIYYYLGRQSFMVMHANAFLFITVLLSYGGLGVIYWTHRMDLRKNGGWI